MQNKKGEYMFTEEKVMTSENPTPEAPTSETPNTDPSPKPTEHSWIEEIEVAGDHLVARVNELIAEGNVRRLIIRSQDKVLFEVPLTAGVAVGGVVTLISPVLAAIGALAALVANVKVEIVRDTDEPK